MPRYSEQFKRDAVALYENNEDLSLHAASAELGVNRSSLFSWLQQYGPDHPTAHPSATPVENNPQHHRERPATQPRTATSVCLR